MWCRAIILVTLCAGLASCASPPLRIEELPPESQRIELDGFAVSTLNESGWLVGQKNAHAVQLLKLGNNTDETYAIQAWVTELPQFYNDEAFVSYIADGMKKGTPSSRFIQQEYNASITNTTHGACVEFTSIHKDLSAKKRTSNPEPMLLEVMGLTCRNPNRPSEGAHLVFSHRYYSGNQDALLPTKAASLFGSLEFWGPQTKPMPL